MFLSDITTDAATSTDTTAAQPSWWQSLLTSAAGVYQQNELMKVNLQRASQGLPPLDSTATAAQVSISANPQQVSQLQTMVILGIAAIVLTLVITSRKRR